ncbi:MFS transporter [Corynebacterium heidelbergense]|uniref:Putative proline/betaine transporter n=1 Tax=Corynebacterium heidelbergense TaxID=2055947 RepID=A0A364V728_9CORY|nr:MFS transporter [Corynebacterium heidelbergense]RAV32455.1 MFS transporter [Corynebacterium heidelbergense]
MSNPPHQPPTAVVSPAPAGPVPPSPEVSAHDRRRAIESSFLGNFVEWFDYAVYGYLSSVIAQVFFPEDSGRTALVKTFGLFAISFLIRPLGAFVWGHIGDRYGRKTALSWSIMIMTGATFCIALLPSHATVGVLAPILLLLLRLIQGFSAAGEYAGASTLLTEYASNGKRGLFAAVVPASTASGLLLGSILATVLTSQLSEADVNSWGWRLPFLLAGPLGLVGLYIRKHLAETPQFEAAEKEIAHSVPLRDVLAEPKALVISLCVALLNAIGFYVILSYLPTYLTDELGQDRTHAFMASTIALLAYIGSVLFTGWLSDRVGRRTVMLVSSVAFVCTAIPAFLLLDKVGFVLLVLIEVFMGLVLALNDGVLPSFLSEQFSTKVRFTGFALTFNIANAVFGGTAPMVATLLIGWTGSKLAPAFYLMLAATITFVAVLRAAETNKEHLR